jgi:hypothetical protein
MYSGLGLVHSMNMSSRLIGISMQLVGLKISRAVCFCLFQLAAVITISRPWIFHPLFKLFKQAIHDELTGGKYPYLIGDSLHVAEDMGAE